MLSEKLVELKRKIIIANAPIQERILTIIELKAKLRWLSEWNTSEGVIYKKV